MQVFISKQRQCSIKIYPTTRHTATLTQLYNSPHRRLPQAFTQTHKRKEKGVATSLLHVDPQHDRSELVPRASRARASRQRAPLDNVHLSTTCTSRQRAPLDNSPRSSLRLHSALYERFLHTSALSMSSATCASPSSLRVASALRQSAGHATPPPAFPRFGNRQMSRICWGDPRGRFGGASRRASEKQADTDAHLLLRRSARAFWREPSPPPRRVSIRPAGSVTTRCTFDGECRWWCV